MLNSTVYNSIKKLSKVKINRLVKFIRSPYFNTNVKIELLIQNFDSGFTTNEDLHASIYPEYKYNRQRLYDLCSELNLLFQKFLALELIEHENKWELEILKGLQSQNLTKQFNSKLKLSINQLERTDARNSDYYFRKYQLAEIKDKIIPKIERQSSDHRLQEKSDYLDIYYLSVKLKAICEMLNRQRIIQSKFELRAITETLNIIENNRGYYFQFPPIHLFYLLTKLYQTGDFKKYEDLVKLLRIQFNKFSLSEAKELYEYLQNHCIREINKGNDTYLDHLYILFKDRIENRLFDKLETITEWTFKTAVTVGLRLKKYQWVYDIINHYKNLLSEDIRENAYNYNLANMYFEMKEFRKALRILNTIEFTDNFYNLDARSLILKIYFENEDSEALSATIQAFKAFLRRNKSLSDNQKLIYSNLLKYTLKTIRLRERKPRRITANFSSKLEALTNEIKDVGLMANKQWLTNQLKSMIK